MEQSNSAKISIPTTANEAPASDITNSTSQATEVTPVKQRLGASSPPLKSSPAALKFFSDLESLKGTVRMFAEQMDTQLCANLYSLSTEETQDIKNTMQSMRTALRAFSNQATNVLFETTLKNRALLKKVAYQQQLIGQLEKDKADLVLKVEKLEKELLEKKIICEQVGDDVHAFDNEDFNTAEPAAKRLC